MIIVLIFELYSMRCKSNDGYTLITRRHKQYYFNHSHAEDHMRAGARSGRYATRLPSLLLSVYLYVSHLNSQQGQQCFSNRILRHV